MTARVRLVAWRVQPVVMLDDGDTLAPLTVDPADVPAAAWDQWVKTDAARIVETLQAQVDTQPTAVDLSPQPGRVPDYDK